MAIERLYGRSERIWVMDRGIPTEEALEAMRQSATPVQYLVGTPKGRLTRLEKDFLGKPWTAVRESVDVKGRERGLTENRFVVPTFWASF
ncbi:MAG: hypothetical protein WD397_07775 [Wenzhouxiangellaceae bacterium]